MASLHINLLIRRGAGEILQQRLFVKLKRGSVFVLAGYTVILLLVFGARLALSAQKNSLEAQVRQAKLKVDAFAATESQQVLLKSKLQLATTTLQRRVDWSGFLGEVMEFIPSESSVTEIGLAQTGDLRITVRTNRLQEVAVMLKALVQLGLQHERIKSVGLSDVQKSADGTYGFTVVIGTKTKVDPIRQAQGEQVVASSSK